jgi:hypothetical protein
MSSLFEEYEESTSIFCYSVKREDYQISEAGRAKLVVGRATVSSEITGESGRFCFVVLHLGDHNLNCGVRGYQSEPSYQELRREVSEELAGVEFAETIRLIDKHFGASTYSLKSLFRDEQRKILAIILESTLADAEAMYRQLYENHAPMMHFIKDLGIPLPQAMHSAAELVLNATIRRALENEELHTDHINSPLEEARVVGVPLDTNTLEYALRNSLERMAELVIENPGEISMIERLVAALDLLASLPFQVNLWKVQNIFYEILQSPYPSYKGKAEKGDKSAMDWVNQFTTLGARLNVRVE